MLRHSVTALVAAACVSPSAAQDFATRGELQSLEGTFRSVAPEPWYGGFGTREFVFSSGEWHLIFTHALDAGMTQRTFQFRTGGPYEIGQPHGVIDGAYRGVFHEDWKHLTLLTDNAELIWHWCVDLERPTTRHVRLSDEPSFCRA